MHVAAFDHLAACHLALLAWPDVPLQNSPNRDCPRCSLTRHASLVMPDQSMPWSTKPSPAGHSKTRFAVPNFAHP